MGPTDLLLINNALTRKCSYGGTESGLCCQEGLYMTNRSTQDNLFRFWLTQLLHLVSFGSLWRALTAYTSTDLLTMEGRFSYFALVVVPLALPDGIVLDGWLSVHFGVNF